MKTAPKAKAPPQVSVSKTMSGADRVSAERLSAPGGLVQRGGYLGKKK